MVKFLAMSIFLMFASEGMARDPSDELELVETDSLSRESIIERLEQMREDTLIGESLAEILDEMQFLLSQFGEDKEFFSGMDTLRVGVFWDEEAENILSEDQAQTKFEATLRKYRLPVASGSWPLPCIALRLNSVGGESIYDLFVFSIAVELRDRVIYSRGERQNQTTGTIWRSAMIGSAGNQTNARELILQSIEQLADEVANLYLSAN